jgi:hypothetical protein
MMRSSVSLIAVTLGTAGGTLAEHFLVEHQRRLLLPTFLGHRAVA